MKKNILIIKINFMNNNNTINLPQDQHDNESFIDTFSLI